MKRKLAAVYDPYLDTLGGGEQHVISICKALGDLGYETHVFWDNDLTQQLEARFHFGFKTPLQFKANIFSGETSLLQKLTTLSQYDILLHVTDGSYFFSTANKNFVFAMAPERALYQLSLWDKIKTFNFKFIANSTFTQKALYNWGVKSQVLYPYLDHEYLDVDISTFKKANVILSVGRFFRRLHAKRQDVMIQTFKQLRQSHPQLHDFKLMLAGGLHPEDHGYFAQLEQMVAGDSHIELLPNASHDRLIELYQKALIYWHFAGYCIDPTAHPERVEHLGIAPLEAMSMGCLTFCYRAGGPQEIIKDAQTGWLFSDTSELSTKMLSVLKDSETQQAVKTNAKIYVQKNFSYEVFKTNVYKCLKL